VILGIAAGLLRRMNEADWEGKARLTEGIRPLGACDSVPKKGLRTWTLIVAIDTALAGAPWTAKFLNLHRRRVEASLQL
jgi:hypothetical protein